MAESETPTSPPTEMEAIIHEAVDMSDDRLKYAVTCAKRALERYTHYED